MYALGIDLGTTFTAAAIWRDGRAEIASLGSRAAAIPSVVLLRDDATMLTGEAASRRGLSEPQRVAREFKRRLGDTTPLLLGGTPYSAEQLMSRLLRWTVDEVAGREGGAAHRLCICHPANWGPYKRELVDQAVRLANIDVPVTFTTEPEAAAAFYAGQQRIEPGAVVAVYDLGGGTFDAAVLRKTSAGFEIMGQPEGIERLGGIDFDAAVFGHVRQALAGKLDELDPEDPTTVAAVARLREECVNAKEALSSDTDAAIPVLLPNLATEIRITRAEFEAMVRPALASTIEAMRRALHSAGVSAEQLHSVLLVGGSSRMPLVAQLVGAELGRPVAVDAHPKHAIALGAAGLASGDRAATTAAPGAITARGSVAGAAATPTAGAPGAVPPVAAVPGAAVPGAAVPGAAGATGASRISGPPPVGRGSPTGAAAGIAHSGFPPDGARRTAAAGGSGPATATQPMPPPRGVAGPPAPGRRTGGRRRNLLIGAATLVTALAVSGVAVALAGGDPPETPLTDAADDAGARQGTADDAGPGDDGPGDQDTSSQDASSQDASDRGTSDAEGDGGDDQLPPDEECTEAIMSNDRWVCLTAARFDGDALVVEYTAEWAGSVPDTGGGFHLHLYGGDGSTPPDEIMGAHASDPGSWQVEDSASPLRYPAGHRLVTDVIGGRPKVCARIADASHHLVPATGGGYTTGNCRTIERP